MSTVLLWEALSDSIEKHLRSRGIDPKRTGVILDKKSGKVTFLLYNLSGQLVGYQRYNPKGHKFSDSNKDPLMAKYYSYITKDPETKTRMLAVWGVDTIRPGQPLFIVEGIFDAAKIHNAGYPAIAVLANNPKHLRSWLRTLSNKRIVIYDKDAAGRKLAKLGHKAYTVPEPYKDLGDMPQKEATQFIKSLVK